MEANSLKMIKPYKYSGRWVFDDPFVDLKREPFVAGADVMIDKITENIPHADKGFQMIFSHEPFPGHMAKLEWDREEFGGNWYRWEATGLQGWLCPALFKYFPKAPQEIYVYVEALRG